MSVSAERSGLGLNPHCSHEPPPPPPVCSYRSVSSLKAGFQRMKKHQAILIIILTGCSGACPAVGSGAKAIVYAAKLGAG